MGLGQEFHRISIEVHSGIRRASGDDRKWNEGPRAEPGRNRGLNGAKLSIPNFQGVARCIPRHRLEAYATLRRRIATPGPGL